MPSEVNGGGAEMNDAVATFLDEISELLDTEQGDAYRFLLTGIADTVRRQRIVTQGQQQTINSIMSGSYRRCPSERCRVSSRRYEGYESSSR
jgi:hypothetical protein